MADGKEFMQRALDLAELGRGYTSPNPMVGCVIECSAEIIGEGYHRTHGEAHAEVNAIRSVSDVDKLTQSTLYVTLEPCSHHGKTPPCADLIIEKGIPRVMVCNSDPNEAVNGQGIKRLREAGIEVVEGILGPQGRALNKRFFTFHEKKRPYLILKYAQTNDGFLDAYRKKDDQMGPLKISSHPMNRLVHKWRTQEDAILVGQNTVALDNPSLTSRHWPGPNPIRLIIDPQLQVDESKRLLSDGHHTWIFNALRNDYCENNLCYIRIEDPGSFEQEILAYLHKNGVQSVIIEGGATTLSRFIEAGLWDEARIITGPMRLGKGVPSPSLTGELVSSQQFGPDLLQVYARV
ncbi:MAG: bifunctional diaminohydroxyphosphoribosylaminopyrimidine deaminase/5-amino-6-(5-phosphoribosylamino)uracil reductase RibD [Cryomorphaceae bacterium]